MTSKQPEESAKDWMEIWYETGEIAWQKPLPPEANARIQALYEELLDEQKRGSGQEADEGPNA